MVNACRFLLAATFIFSGVVKLIDPRGTEYKIQDYGQAFGCASWLPSYVPLILSVMLALFEFMVGVYLFFGSHRLRTTRLLLLFMIVVTPLTFYLALKNPVSDCGCFGDAWVLTNWQTFFKNLVLLAASVVVFYKPKQMTRFITERNQWMISLYSWVFGGVLAMVCIYGLPVMDFRPYHIGADILEKMSLNGTGETELETYFLMEKDGERREFTLADYPDSTWTLVDTRTEQSDNAEMMPEINDFVVTSVETGEDVTMEILQDTTYKFLLVAPYLENADDGSMDRIAALYEYGRDYGYPFYGLTASGEEAIRHWQDMTGAEYPFYHVDDVVLKTMVRSNPGLMLMHGSMVVNKWPCSGFPNPEVLTAPLEKLDIAHPSRTGYVQRLVKLLLWYLIPLVIWTLIDRIWVFLRWRKGRRK